MYFFQNWTSVSKGKEECGFLFGKDEKTQKNHGSLSNTSKMLQSDTVGVVKSFNPYCSTCDSKQCTSAFNPKFKQCRSVIDTQLAGQLWINQFTIIAFFVVWLNAFRLLFNPFLTFIVWRLSPELNPSKRLTISSRLEWILKGKLSALPLAGILSGNTKRGSTLMVNCYG